MAMAPERSKPLHNFSLPHLKWGNQRFLRCMKVNSTAEIASTDRRSFASEPESSDVLIKHSSESDKRSRSPSGFRTTFVKPSPAGKSSGVKSKSKIERDGDDGGIEEIREKLMFHLRSAADKMKFAIPEETEGDESESAVAAATAARPWNLRTRRAACKAPEATGGGGGGGGSSKFEERQQKSLRSRDVGSSSPGMEKKEKEKKKKEEEKKERRKFSIRLTRGEIEEDFAMMNGTRPSRRPKKRVKIVQQQLDTLFPGLWLTEITAESYKIPDEPDNKKRSR